MNISKVKRAALMAVPSILVLALALVLGGCGKGGTATPKGETAKGALSTAESALSTMAPDAKLLVVQTAQSVTATGTPVWAYLWGSPKSGKTYLVYVSNGKAMGAMEYGAAGLSADQWKKVPSTGDWKIDSNTAYEKAVSASGSKATPSAYMMGMQTYVPESASQTQTVDPFVWYVQLDLGDGAVHSVKVDAKTGKATKN